MFEDSVFTFSSVNFLCHFFSASHAVLKIFTSTVQHKRMLSDGTLIDIKREPEHL
jgi:hypothetical protein